MWLYGASHIHRGPMVKRDVVNKLRLKESLSFGEAEQIINDLIEIIKETLESGEEVLISGFGKFELTCLSNQIISDRDIWGIQW